MDESSEEREILTRRALAGRVPLKKCKRCGKWFDPKFYDLPAVKVFGANDKCIGHWELSDHEVIDQIYGKPPFFP